MLVASKWRHFYQDQGSLCKQLEQKKQDSTCVVEVQEAISEAPVV